MSTTLPHFDHHVREMYRTRRRFSGLVIATLVVASAVVVVARPPKQAAASCDTNTTSSYVTPILSERTPPGPNATVSRGTTISYHIGYQNTWNGDLTTSAQVSAVLPSNTTLVSQDTSHTDPYVTSAGYNSSTRTVYWNLSKFPASSASYSHFEWGVNVVVNNNAPYSSLIQTHTTTSYVGYCVTFLKDSPVVNNYMQAAPPPPVPPAPQTPPAPAPKTPVPTGNSGAGGGNGGSTSSNVPGGSTGSGAVQPQSVDATPPAAPTTFTALADGNNAVVTLSWDAASDPSGIKGYELDRSTDNTTWSPLSTSLTDTGYSDTKAAFGVHYYYRLNATDNAGNTSGYALADATTPNFNANTGSNDSTYTSDDNVAVVTLAAGSIDGDADCSVTPGDKKTASKDHPIAAGPYALVCKTSSGDLINSYKKPLLWAYSLKDKLKNLTSPQGVKYDQDGNASAVKGVLDAKTQVFKFQVADSSQTAVMAATKKGLPLNLIVIVLVILLIIGGFVVFILRRSQKQNYQEYIRSKYYNL